MRLKRLTLIVACLLSAAAVSPGFDDLINRDQSLTAQEIPCAGEGCGGDDGGGDGGGGGCQQTCSPMPAGCGSGYFACDAKPSCVNCSCRTDPASGKRECTETIRYPAQTNP